MRTTPGGLANLQPSLMGSADPLMHLPPKRLMYARVELFVRRGPGRRRTRSLGIPHDAPSTSAFVSNRGLVIQGFGSGSVDLPFSERMAAEE